MKKTHVVAIALSVAALGIYEFVVQPQLNKALNRTA